MFLSLRNNMKENIIEENSVSSLPSNSSSSKISIEDKNSLEVIKSSFKDSKYENFLNDFSLPKNLSVCEDGEFFKSGNSESKTRSMKRAFSMKYRSMSSRIITLQNSILKRNSDDSSDIKLTFMEKKYARNCTTFPNFVYISEYKDLKVNDLVEIIGEDDIFGRISCFATNSKKYLVGISENDDLLKKLSSKLESIHFKDTCLDRPFKGIFVRSDCVKPFNYSVGSLTTKLLQKETFKFVENHCSDMWLKNDIIKFYNSDVVMYGKIRRFVIINNWSCLEFTSINDGVEHSELKYLKESDAIKVEELQSELDIFERVIIAPKNIIFCKPFTSDCWKKGDVACFEMKSSNYIFSGEVQVTLVINDLPAAIFKLNENENDEMICDHKLLDKLLKLLDIEGIQKAYFVPISVLENQKTLHLMNIIKYILHNENDWHNKIINQVIEMNDESVLSFIIYHTKAEIDLEGCPEILDLLFKKEDLATLKVLLSKSNSGMHSNFILLDIAYQCIVQEIEEMFWIIMDKCSDFNVLMENKETFLTKIIKEQVSEELIVEIIEKLDIDSTICNDDGCSPLILACRTFKLPVIEALLKLPNRDSSQIESALDEVFKNIEELSEKDCRKALQVAAILKKYHPMLENLNNECIVCKDKKKDTTFSCGHQVCNSCSETLTECPICRAKITNRIKTYT